MIKIERLSAPEELTPEVIAEKTARFKADPKHNHVWKESYIESRLMEMTHNKCCYCECRLGEESKYMEVEHFHDKSKYQDEVVVWDNLFPSCKSCNGSKSDHDTIAAPIVNPVLDNPGDHLGFKHFRYIGKDEKGRETIEVLNLNDSVKKCMPRFMICIALEELLEEIRNNLENIDITSRTQDISRLRNKVLKLLQECQCDSPYTAVKASMVASDSTFLYLVKKMKERGWWTPIMDELASRMESYQLDILS